MFTILNNTFLNTRRRAGRQPAEVDSETVERAADLVSTTGQTPEQILMRDSLDADLQAALDSIPEAFRQGPAAPERAEMLGDTGDSDPGNWVLGGSGTPTVHLMLCSCICPFLRCLPDHERTVPPSSREAA